MRERSEYLSERELFVLEHHPAMTYKQIGQELGLSPERVRQLKVHAERLIREERARVQAHEDAKLPVQLVLQRRDVSMIIDAMREYHTELLLKKHNDQVRGKENDAAYDQWLQRADEIVEKLTEGYSKRPFLTVISTYNSYTPE